MEKSFTGKRYEECDSKIKSRTEADIARFFSPAELAVMRWVRLRIPI